VAMSVTGAPISDQVAPIALQAPSLASALRASSGVNVRRGGGPNVPVRDLSAGRCSLTATFNLNFLVRASRQNSDPAAR
jgi:hypothetical protein